MADVGVVINLRSQLGEGPVWDHRGQLLAWVDILGGLVHLTVPDTGVTTTIPVGAPVGALGLLGDDGYMLAVRNGFAPLHGGRLGDTEVVFESAELRLNDAGTDPAGRFVAGSMANDHSSGRGTLYVRDFDGSVRPLVDGVTISNGLAWSADGRSLFYVDSALQAIDVLDYDVVAGAVSGRRRWVDVPEADGTPDGITIDGEGHIWVALWGGGKVRRYSPEGAVVRDIDLPAARVSSCAFGGLESDRLFITTAAAGGEQGGLDGALFEADPGCVGVASPVVRAQP